MGTAETLEKPGWKSPAQSERKCPASKAKNGTVPGTVLCPEWSLNRVDFAIGEVLPDVAEFSRARGPPPLSGARKPQHFLTP